MRPATTAPRERKRSVRVIDVVMSCASLPNCTARRVTESETLKKSPGA
jgi:hypothetical protein